MVVFFAFLDVFELFDDGIEYDGVFDDFTANVDCFTFPEVLVKFSFSDVSTDFFSLFFRNLSESCSKY